MKQLFTAAFFLFTAQTFCQLTREQRLQDSVVGWDPKNYYDRNYKPQTSAVGKQREAYVNKFAEWMKASYTPVAGLGEYQRFVNANNGSVTFSVWDVAFDYLDADKHFRPVGETGFPRFYLAANTLAGTWNIDFMCRPNEWFFTMQPDGSAPNETERKKRLNSDAKISESIRPFLSWKNDWYAVYLTPGNKLPIVPVTKGDFLRAALNRMDYLQDSLVKEDTEKEYRKDEAAKKRIYDFRKGEVDRYRDNISQLLTKYNDRLNEPAEVRNRQFTYHDITTGSWDVFGGGPNTVYYPVYKIDGATVQKMSCAQPVWIAAIFPFQTAGDGAKAYEMYRSMTEHLNYQYIYDYFFDPEKVKGVGYKPLNEEALKARLEAYRARNNDNLAASSQKKSWGSNVYFAEDFSGATEGGEPADWFFYRPGSTPFSVVSLPGEKGKWLKLGTGRSIKPVLLKAPLPKNFTLECDVATDKAFSGRTGGALQLTLTNSNLNTNNDVSGKSSDQKSASVEIRIEAGNEADYNNNNYRGLLRADVKNYPNDPNEQNNAKGIRAQYELRQFTDGQSRVHITLTVKDGGLNVWVNDKPVIKPSDYKLTYGGNCVLCGVPGELQFRNLLLNNVTDSRSGAGIYVSNIRLVKN